MCDHLHVTREFFELAAVRILSPADFYTIDLDWLLSVRSRIQSSLPLQIDEAGVGFAHELLMVSNLNRKSIRAIGSRRRLAASASRARWPPSPLPQVPKKLPKCRGVPSVDAVVSTACLSTGPWQKASTTSLGLVSCEKQRPAATMPATSCSRVGDSEFRNFFVHLLQVLFTNF
jgi:hypothetical protein